MKVTRFFALSMMFAIALAHSADARPRPKGFGGKSFEANKTFGLGLELGEPSGITGKYFLSPSGAIDFGLGYIYGHYYAGDGLHVYADYLWHPLVLASAAPFELPFYIGLGGRFWSFDYGCEPNGRNCAYDGAAFGVRVPLGLDLDFNNVPLDIFFQIVPTLDFYRHYRDRDLYLGIDASIGVRFWFN
jgi:hypothetical protein